jgi:hypothetical protein
MHYRHVSDLTNSYDLVCLSPHLDDAALSCGGELIMARQAGLRTLVVTVCTAVPPESQSYSALAVEFHAEWGLDHAEAVTYYLAYHHDPGTASPAFPLPLDPPFSLGEWHDRFVRTADGWRIAHRETRRLFERRGGH